MVDAIELLMTPQDVPAKARQPDARTGDRQVERRLLPYGVLTAALTVVVILFGVSLVLGYANLDVAAGCAACSAGESPPRSCWSGCGCRARWAASSASASACPAPPCRV